MKTPPATVIRWILGGALLALACYAWYVNLVPSDVLGPEPELGFDETPPDYDVPQLPDAPIVPVPLFDREQLSQAPFSISFPEMQAGRDMALVGEIQHPNTTVTGSLVRLGFYERPGRGETERHRRSGIQGFAKGEGGLLAYRIEGQTPRRAGIYDVWVELDHPILDEDVDELPVEERMTTTLIATGQIVVTN